MDGTATSEYDSTSLFGRPLFNDPKARALSRVGVVDIGSNSVRLVVFDGAARSPAYFYNEKLMCALGAGMSDTGRLNPQGRDRALQALKRFHALAEGMNLPPLTVVATAAVREAEDGPEFREDVLRETGLRIWVIGGEEEARLSAQGVLLGWPGSYGLVCDIGGSSMELAEISEGRVGRRISSNLGPLKLRDVKGGYKGRDAHIKEVMAKLAEHMGAQRDRLFLVGGSWRAIARIDMYRRGYPLHVLHEYRMNRKSVSQTVKFIKSSDLEELRQACGVSSARMELVPYASEVLKRLVQTFSPKDIAISSYGIREGLLYEQMPQELRDRDPLIEACRFAEAKDARLPGFGKKLFKFVMPLFSRSDAARMRLIKAACLLHDVSWRAHPDYRAETCFDNATRANLGGLKHSERVFLGLALLHRYKNKREGTRFEDLEELLSETATQEAEVLGKALRFGAMLWMSDASADGTALEWKPRKKLLRLKLTKASVPLYGEVAQARLQSLAASLGAEVDVKILR
ncbi:Ppx/GppA family phosphatase [Marivita hallyeonensis]|uniref:Exopolyphosphatase / guanosine-5'-triphosphate,3'-diphosphate pyrophosphatase n=1 Tax=Marivita hallyeonensis TaxID=996342 RepID=A0A1M5W4Y6_9RHOB|nr:Ppx/GppA family phosphatase [Marivita hallyeonensis]SHH82546.1 exopolyphosphatase / guanosine-5'-triphosphate,3'-diphosphate pyrophosphatase [Marivita hallyeonensis]